MAYSYDRSKTAGAYSDALIGVVKVVDKLEGGAKGIARAKQGLAKAKQFARKDPDVEAFGELPFPDRMNKDAVFQQIEFLEKALDDAAAAVKHLVGQYDDTNSSFGRLKLK